MFTASCFIRKNTPELINELIDLGYVKALFDEEYTKSDAYGLIIDQGDIVPLEHGLQEMELMFTYNFVDCRTNEELFIALASLRDDTPINNFYWFNRRLVKCEDKTEKHTFLNGFIPILKCRCVDDPNICFGVEEDFLKKATVEELIEHFKEE